MEVDPASGLVRTPRRITVSDGAASVKFSPDGTWLAIVQTAITFTSLIFEGRS